MEAFRNALTGRPPFPRNSGKRRFLKSMASGVTIVHWPRRMAALSSPRVTTCQNCASKMSDTPKDFSDRLNLALSRAGMNRAQLATACGVAASTISRWQNVNTPNPALLSVAAKTLGVRREWLVAGTQPMQAPDTPEADSQIALLEEPSAHRSRYKPPTREQMYLDLMIGILHEVRKGRKPLEALEEIHALLDLLHPMPQKV